MKKIIASLLASAALTTPVFADPLKDSEYFTMHSMGCMMLRECTDNVRRITSIKDIQDSYPNSDYSAVAIEFNEMLDSLDKIGVMVFLGDQKYFPIGNRGVYHTVSNNFFLNDAFMGRQSTLMSVVRHEGWHAAQDCMAGTIDNSMIAIILREDDVPSIWREIAEKTYPKSVVPWEAEASWAGRTENMTADALAACATGKIWEIYEPTPLTREYLVKEGYITK